jgi:hypothetical protein
MPGDGSGAVGHMATPEFSLTERRVWCCRTRGDTGALSHREAGFGVTGHVVMSEPSRAGRWGLAPQGTWRRRSPSVLGGGVWRHGTRGDARALPCWETVSDVMGHVIKPEPSHARR